MDSEVAVTPCISNKLRPFWHVFLFGMFDRDFVHDVLACYSHSGMSHVLLFGTGTCFVVLRPGTLVLHGRRALGCSTGMAFI